MLIKRDLLNYSFCIINWLGIAVDDTIYTQIYIETNIWQQQAIPFPFLLKSTIFVCFF